MSKNLATTTIASHPGPPTSATSVTVATGTGSRLYVGMAVIHPANTTPTPANAEVVSITDVTGDALTIVRAQESSTARAIATGDVITQGITAAMWDTLVASNAAKADGAATTSALAGKANTSHVHSAADITSGTLGLARGGTGGTDAATARASLGLGTAAVESPATLAGNAAFTAIYAPLASPALTGNPTAPTPSPGDNDTSIATTAFVAAAASTSTGRPLPGVPVATNCYYNQQVSPAVPNGTIGTNGTSRSKHRATTTFSDPVLIYGNATGGGTGEVDGPNTYTIKASIEWNGIILPVTFNGSLTGTCSPGGLLISDPAGVEFVVGTDFRVRTYVTADGTNAVLANTASNPNTGQGFAAGDLTAAGSAAIADSYSFIYAPHAILGQPATPGAPTVGLVGDSIMCGTGDAAASTPVTEWANNTSAQAGGFALRALARQFGYVHIGAGSERSTHFAARHRRAVLLSSCKYFICEYGTNDLFAGAQTVAATQAGLIGTWLAIRRRGPSIWQTTITPQSSSTDSWATVGNQTPLAANSNRITLNAWIRDGAPLNSSTLAAVATGTVGALRAGQAGHPLVGYFECADAVESARDSGVWKAAHTADGVHPNTTGHIAMAGAINTSLFA